jgi:fermentation-respiration switch protein FrsA (DUF1100 family)
MKLILALISFVYVTVCLVAYLLQSRFVYFPDREEAGTPADVGLDFEEVTFASASGTRLHGWYVSVPGARYTLLYCHGNAGNISHRLESIRRFADRGLSVFIFDYSGYGKSAGRPSERATYADALGAWDWLTRTAGVKRDGVILFGRSLGTAVAIDLATEVQARGLILESPFTSAVELGARAFWWLPVRFLARIRYNSMGKIAAVKEPKLFVHSLQDEVVPYGMGKRLYNRAPRPKMWVKAQGGHNDVYLEPGSAYDEALDRFLAGLDEPRGVRRL